MSALGHSDVEIKGGWIARPLLVEPLVHLTNVSVAPDVFIGRRSYMNDGWIGPNVRIGRYCSIARLVSIGLSNHPVDWLSTHPFQFDPQFRFAGSEFPNKRTTIGNDVWVATNATILQGVTIGDGSVIAAGSVVSRDVPPYTVVAGVPARPIKPRFPPDLVKRLLDVRWWDREESELKGLDFRDLKQCLERFESVPRKEPTFNYLPV